MNTIEMMNLAHSLDMELIENGNTRELCLREQLFAEDGTRLVRYYPDPVEFRPRAEVEARLSQLAMSLSVNQL